MKANEGARRDGFGADRRGNQHMVEVMFVAAIVVGAVLTVTSMDSDSLPKAATEGAAHQSELDAFLQTYSGMPSKNDTIRFSNMLEEWSIQEVTGQDNPIYQRVQANWPGVGSRLWLQHQGVPFPMMGPPSKPVGPVQVAGELYTPAWGVTLARPGMSHYNPTQGVDVAMMPLEAAGVLDQPGMPYVVTTKYTDDDERLYKQFMHGHVRAGNERDEANHPILVRFEDALGGMVEYADATHIFTNIKTQIWAVRINLTAPGADIDDVWWRDGILRLHTPAGWNFNATGLQTDWTQEADEYGDAAHRLRYNGPSLRGTDGQTLVLNFTRPVDDLLDQNDIVSVWTEGPRTSSNHLPLHTALVTRDLPVSVLTSGAEPLVTHTDGTLRVHVVNGRNMDVDVTEVEVRFPERSYQFRDYEAAPLVGPGTGGIALRYNTDGTDAIFTWTGSLDLDSGTSQLIALDIHTAKVESHGPYRFVEPELSVRDDGGALLDQVIGAPHGSDGMYRALLPPYADSGTYALRVSDIPGGSPPGVGSFEVHADPTGLLDDIQRARNSMHIDALPAIHKANEPVQVRVNTADLLKTLRGMDAVNPDSLRMRVTATDLLGYFTDTPNLQAEYSIDLDVATAIVGIDFMDANTDTIDDVIVTYRDGHVLALDGASLPDNRVWRAELPGDVTSPPVMFNIDADPENELVVAITTPTGLHQLYAIHTDGTQEQLTTLTGYASHLTLSECNPGIWFQESDLDRLPLEHATNNYGFMEEAPVDTRLAHWSPDGGLEYGPVMSRVNPYKIMEAKFAPFAQCSVLQAMERGSATDPHLFLVRSNATTMKESWRHEDDGHLRGIWVRDTITTPIEFPTAQNPNPARSHEIILVTDEHGIEVLSGWVKPVRAEKVPAPPMIVGDNVLGLSWVNHDTGYIATELGHVFVTTDAGNTWDEMAGSPIVPTGMTLVDFAFGGDGSGVFERDDGAISWWTGVKWRAWDVDALAQVRVAGLVAGIISPGIIENPSTNDFGIRLFTDFAGDLGATQFSISCACAEVVGSGITIAGADGGWLQASTALAVLGAADDAHRATSTPAGWLLAHDADGLRFLNESLDSVIEIESTGLLALGGVSKATSTMQGADIIDGHALYTLHDGTLSAFVPEAVGWTNTSVGLGARWLLNTTDMIRVDPASSYWSYVRPGDDVAESDSISFLVEADPGNTREEYRIHWPSGTVDPLPAGIQVVRPWQPGALLEYIPNGVNPSPVGSGASLTVTVGGTDRALLTSTTIDCGQCLAPVGWADDVQYGSQVWADADGVLPRHQVTLVGPDPVLVDQEAGAPLLVVGDLSTGVYAYAMDTGVPTLEIDTSTVQPGELLDYFVVSQAGAGDLLFAEVGTDDLGVGLGAGLSPGAGLSNPLAVRLIQLDSTTGAAICSAPWQETDSLGNRIMRTKADAQSTLLTGTGLGRLGQTQNGGCAADWEQQPIDTGTVLTVNIDAPVGNWLGPQIYLIDLIVDVAPLGEVELHLMDYTIRSDQGLARPDVYYWMFLEVYDPGDMWG